MRTLRDSARSLVPAAVLLLLTTGCTAGPRIDIATPDPESLAAARTVGASPESPIVMDEGINPEVADWIADAVKRELVARGFQTGDSPDLVGRARVLLKDDTITFDYARGEDYVFDYKLGTLVLEFMDAESGDLVWHGAAEGIVEPGVGPEDIDAVIVRLLEGWPSVEG
ncbi:MAG: DUF4136 domain-containing protein [Planctomycetota bacterium]